MNIPEPAGEYLVQWVSKRYAIGYIMMDKDGRIRSWGGELNRLGIGSLTMGQSITEPIEIMEGMLPLKETDLRLPMVKPDDQHIWNVHLFKTGDGYGLLLMDGHDDAELREQFQQKANASALVHQTQDALHAAREIPLQIELIENLFYACNMAALELRADGQFHLIGRSPGWLQQFCPDTAIQPCCLDPDNVFSFLDNFLHDAHVFWAEKRVGCLKSGLWIELDTHGNEHLFEATAIQTGNRKILLIAKELSMFAEKQALIQKGREIALGRSSLERKQSELQAAREDLELRVQERTRELERINIRLARELEHRKQLETERTEMVKQMQQAQKMEAIGTLAGGIAHDFNNILSSVIGFTELSLMDAAQGSQLQTNLQHVLSAGQRAKKLIRQILTFSRQSNPETQPVQIDLILKEAIELLRASLPPTIEIRQELNSDAFVMADPSQIHQVVMNLCTNASHAMASTGGVLELVLRNREIGPESAAQYPDMLPGTHIELAITDNGNGMSAETLSRIYDPFFTTKEKGQGTGLGLSVVHGIVKSCKGDITVTSQLGRGTTFRVTLPTVKEIEQTEFKLKTELPRGNERILFVDDEPLHADLVMKFLTPLGYQVKTFIDSTAAWDAFSRAPDQYDLVLTDLYMPKMTGKVLSRQISGIRPGIPIILCSGYSDSPVDSGFPDQTVKHYLMKPFGMRELATTVRRVLDSSA